MSDLISKLSDDQAVEVLERLVAGGADMARRVEAEAKLVLAALDSDEVADDVFAELDSIAVEDCWDMAGSRRDGYMSAEDAAAYLIEEAVQPFANRVLSL